MRTVEAVVEGHRKVECVLDTGAQLVVIKKSIWEGLNVPMKPTQTYNMVAAKHTRTSPLGKLENVWVRFGNVELYIQAQVVEDAPFDLLLGQPFFALAEVRTSHSASGEQLITLKDPNSSEVVTLATREKVEQGPGFR